MKTISVNLSINSIDKAIKELTAYKKNIEKKCMELCKRLSEIGLEHATMDFQSVNYVGEKDVNVVVKKTENGYSIIANGETVLILEFGAGKTYGYGHPQATDFGMGPGTHPDPHYRTINGQEIANWENPDGWYVPGTHGTKTLGNAPAMAMYNSAQAMRREIERIAKEVFAND